MDRRPLDRDSSLKTMELEDIATRISALDKWRSIFSSQGLEIRTPAMQATQDPHKADEEIEERAETTNSKKHGTFPGSIFYSIPRELIIASDLGGQPISIEMAMALKKILFGNTFQTFNYEWKKSFFKFREAFSEQAYGFEAEKGGTRAIQLVVQAHIIKYLLFTRNKHEYTSIKSLSELSQKQQEMALATSIADILWTTGEMKRATTCLITSDSYFTESPDYKTDNFTERLQLFEFVEKDKLEKFVCAHIHCFKEEGSHGVILFLYSLLFSRTIERIQQDLDHTISHLLHFCFGNYTVRQAVLNLMLTGRASPHVFNGDRAVDDENVEQKYHGVLTRSDVGYLHWGREEMEHNRLPQVGSMLKTPKYPIWLCNINGTYSVLFGTNMSLLCDWKMEHSFELYFYSGQSTQRKTAHLTIDTHSHHWEKTYKIDEGDHEKKFPSLEMTIRTKWEGAAINWHGTMPFF
ncbi:inactive ubiquitin carboxyl-terminal hydrolase MINDY-4B [Anomaloglossus baeobatrachus]|uniref:inactive ubiquitin carboxyl-terminal hydrolase MINDY-4B n=1 Tax=Anomaloglossus baeobatrachus TaxID=238106 RepID=UPI003F4FEBBB